MKGTKANLTQEKRKADKNHHRNPDDLEADDSPTEEEIVSFIKNGSTDFFPLDQII